MVLIYIHLLYQLFTPNSVSLDSLAHQLEKTPYLQTLYLQQLHIELEHSFVTTCQLLSTLYWYCPFISHSVAVGYTNFGQSAHSSVGLGSQSS